MISALVGLLSLCCFFVVTRGDVWMEGWRGLPAQFAKRAESSYAEAATLENKMNNVRIIQKRED